MTDTNIDKLLDDLMASIEGKGYKPEDMQIIVAPTPLEEVALEVFEPGNIRPIRQKFPSRVLRSSYRVNDIRAGLDTFEMFLSSPTTM